MVITLVIDTFGATNNGTTVTCMRTASFLKKHGHEVRIIAYVPEEHDDLSDYRILSVPRIHIPIFDKLILDNGMVLAKGNLKEIAEFIQGSDVVHLLLPFHLESQVRKVAKVMQIPVTSAFHCQPENVSYNIHMGHVKPVSSLIYALFRRWCYRYTRHVHTPSEMMADQMRLHHYKNIIHPISNGISPIFRPLPVEKEERFKDKFVILMVGRFSGEKRQDLLFKAIGHSKYNDKIQLVLCGQGPLRKKYEKLSKKYLKNPCFFEFHRQKELLKLINQCDLYVHASDAESEAISCIEAFACGIVPVISDSPISATNSFSLDDRCLFKAGKYRSLQERIEYFYEHPEEKRKLSEKYVEYGKGFALDKCVHLLEEMFEQAILDDKEDQKLHRSYFTNASERRKLRKVAKEIGIENPDIYKESVR